MSVDYHGNSVTGWNNPQEYSRYRQSKRQEWMTEDEMKMVDEMIGCLNNNQGNLSDIYARWEKEEEAYKMEQPKIKNRPNTRVNILAANIEGQVSAIVEQNLAITTRGEEPSDQPFAEWGRIGLEWTFRKNKIRGIIEQHERRRLKFGGAWLKVHFDPLAIYGYGLTKITSPQLGKIFIDGKIKDPMQYQEAEYIAELIPYSKSQIEERYGEEKAMAIEYGLLPTFENLVFQERDAEDDDTRCHVVQWWCKYKGVLRLIEFSADGILLYDSHKKGTRFDNQIDADYMRKPYYKFVDNKYPLFYTGLYPEEGQFYGFGDGKLLRPLQDMINDLYDKIRIAARPHLILFDPESEVDLDEVDDNSFDPIPAVNPTRAVHTVAWGVVNESWWRLLSAIHTEAQRVSRFSDLMIGQAGAAATATEASIQQQQGNASTNQKKLQLEQTLIDVSNYCLGMAMELYPEEKAFRISSKKDKYEWIDFRKMAEVPMVKPASTEYVKQYRQQQQKAGVKRPKRPQWEILTNDDGSMITKNVDLDIEISIGAGLPKNKAFLWQMITQLAPIVVEEKPLMSWQELRNFVVDFLGIPLTSEEELRLQQQIEQQNMQIQQAQQQGNAPTPQGAEAEGVSQGGSPSASLASGTPREAPAQAAVGQRG